MRDLAIAYGNNRQAKQWVNKTIKYEDLKDRLKVTIRTSESAEEYAKFSKAQRDDAKDHGGFVAGVLKDGRRKVDSVESRSMVALVVVSGETSRITPSRTLTAPKTTSSARTMRALAKIISCMAYSGLFSSRQRSATRSRTSSS